MIFDDGDSLRFDLGPDSPFFFKCQRCRVCCNNKRIAPNEYEIGRMAARCGLSTAGFTANFLADGERTIRLKPDGDCMFLTADGCGIHPDRPLVCRLFPLGLIRGQDGRLKYSLMPLHPDCVGYLSGEGTIRNYLDSEGTGPYGDSD